MPTEMLRVFFCRKKLLGFLVLSLVLAKGRGFFYQMIWTTRPHFAKSHSLSLPYVPRSPCPCTPYTRQRAWGTGWGEERAYGHGTFPDVAWLKRRVAGLPKFRWERSAEPNVFVKYNQPKPVQTKPSNLFAKGLHRFMWPIPPLPSIGKIRLGAVWPTKLTEVDGRSRKYTFGLANGLSVHDAMMARGG